MLFQYGAGSYGNNLSELQSSNITSGTVVDNANASSFDLLLTGTPLYWTGAVNATWDGSNDWLTTGGTSAAWANGDIAVFEGTGVPATITIAANIEPAPAEMLFLGGQNFTIAASSNAALSLASDATITVAPTFTATISAPVVGGELVANLPNATLQLTASNTFSGGATVETGTLAIASNAALGNAAWPLTFDGAGTLQALATMTLATSGIDREIVTPDDPSLAVTIDTNSGHTVTVPGAISGEGGLTASNSGTGSGTVVLSAVNTFGGVTTITANEELLLKNALALQNSTFDTTGTGQLSFDSLGNATFGGLQGTGILTLQNAASPPAALALTVGGNGSDTIMNGAIGGSGSLTKTGVGTLYAGVANSFTGGIDITGGTVQIGNPSALARAAWPWTTGPWISTARALRWDCWPAASATA